MNTLHFQKRKLDKYFGQLFGFEAWIVCKDGRTMRDVTEGFPEEHTSSPTKDAKVDEVSVVSGASALELKAATHLTKIQSFRIEEATWISGETLPQDGVKDR